MNWLWVINIKYNDNPYMYNVGLDAHNNYPVSIEQIIIDIRQKKDELNKEGH